VLDAEACRPVRLFLSASAPLSVETFQAFRARTGHSILECWGLTETLTNAANPLEGERRPGTVGFPVPGVEVRVVDAAGHPQPPGTAGGLEVRPAQMFAGYWRQPDATAAAFRPDGFFVTGDLGRMGEDGFLCRRGASSDIASAHGAG
jgi:malonyl-CoA/methylmalonyl-CoA synthetase